MKTVRFNVLGRGKNHKIMFLYHTDMFEADFLNNEL